MIDFPGVDQVLALASAELDAVELLAVERKPAAEIRRTAGHQHPQHFSPHWHGWLKPENRCLVPANGFSEYAPWPAASQDKLYVLCAIVHHMMERIADGSQWSDRLRQTIAGAPVDIGLMGFPEDWLEQPFWGAS